MSNTEQRLAAQEVVGVVKNPKAPPETVKLSKLERDLLLLRDECHNGSWAEMLQFLNQQLEKPALFHRIRANIEADIPRIQALQAYEQKYNVDVSKLNYENGSWFTQSPE